MEEKKRLFVLPGNGSWNGKKLFGRLADIKNLH